MRTMQTAIQETANREYIVSYKPFVNICVCARQHTMYLTFFRIFFVLLLHISLFPCIAKQTHEQTNGGEFRDILYFLAKCMHTKLHPNESFCASWFLANASIQEFYFLFIFLLCLNFSVHLRISQRFIIHIWPENSYILSHNWFTLI